MKVPCLVFFSLLKGDSNDDNEVYDDALVDGYLLPRACRRQKVTKMMMTTTMEMQIMITPRSVGICLLELAEGRPPLSHLHPMRALMQVGLTN